MYMRILFFITHFWRRESSQKRIAMRHLVIWLHGLGDSGDGWSHLRREMGVRAEWQFPTAPTQPVSCNGGHRMTSWMDLEEIPVTHPERFDDAEGLQVCNQRALYGWMWRRFAGGPTVAS